ncbi:MAG: hypothetical protein VX944_11940, partial [Myxococcota bacterium]|nr:hypothetical protein [Myxococcota bacterium]
MGKALQILVLDQREDVRGYLNSHHPGTDLKVLKVSTPEDAVAHASASTALIFVNGDDPDMAQTVALIKGTPTTAAIPVVLLTDGSQHDLLVDQWYSATPPDFTAKRPISSGFLDEPLRAIFRSESPSKTAEKAPAAPAAPPPKDDSQLVKALTDQLAALNKEVKELKEAAEAQEGSGDAAAEAERAAEAARAASQVEIEGHTKRIAELEDTLAKRTESIAAFKERIEQLEQARTAQANAAQAEADRLAEEAKAAAEAASGEASAAQSRADEARAALERAQADGESAKEQLESAHTVMRELQAALDAARGEHEAAQVELDAARTERDAAQQRITEADSR